MEKNPAFSTFEVETVLDREINNLYLITAASTAASTVDHFGESSMKGTCTQVMKSLWIAYYQGNPSYPPPKLPPLRNKALLRETNNPLIRPY